MRILKLKIRECCVCGTTWNIHLHHVVFRSQGGDDTEANIVGLCEYHHRQIHAMDPLAWESLGEIGRAHV